MLFSRSGRSIFPLLPPYGAHDPNGGPGRIIPMHPDNITPYLGLRSRLSQIWMNRWTILLLLVLARVLIALTSLDTNMGSAKREALSACTSVESMGSNMASMPHYLSQGVNELTASGVENAVSALQKMLVLTVTGVEELVIFVIKMLYQTYLCLALLVIRGSVEVGLGLIKDATDYLNSAIKDVGKDLADTAESFTSAYNTLMDDVSKVGTLFGAGKIPQLDVSSLVDKLDNAHLPAGIQDGLNKINSSIPTFDEASNYTESLIRKPFEEIKQLMNESMGSWTFDRETLPVPAKKQLSFCDNNDGINSFFNGVSDIEQTARKIFIAVLIVAAVLACLPMVWQEIRRWRSMKERSQLVTREAHDPMDVVYIVSRPFSAAVGIKAASRFSNSRRQILVRWVIAYATSPSALFVLCLALAGLLACLCQYLLINAVEKSIPNLSAHVGDFADKVVASLDESSAEWANSANGVIGNMNNDLNNNLFGWVNTSTTSLNDTLNAFVDTTTNVLNNTWGDTVLFQPLMDVFDCLIGLKIAGIERGLTWVHDNAHIDFPSLPNDTLSKGAAASISDSNSDASDSFLADAGDSTSNKITEVVYRVTSTIKSGIRTEALISTAILLVYLANLLIGVIRALSLFWRRERNRGEGGVAPMNNDPQGPDGSGFTNVPLTAVPSNQEFASSQPAPQYEPRRTDRSVPGLAVTRDSFFEDEKLGFAGHRNALKVSTMSHIRGSSYVEYGGEKR